MLLYGFRRQRLLHPEVVKNKEIVSGSNLQSLQKHILHYINCEVHRQHYYFFGELNLQCLCLLLLLLLLLFCWLSKWIHSQIIN